MEDNALGANFSVSLPLQGFTGEGRSSVGQIPLIFLLPPFILPASERGNPQAWPDFGTFLAPLCIKKGHNLVTHGSKTHVRACMGSKTHIRRRRRRHRLSSTTRSFKNLEGREEDRGLYLDQRRRRVLSLSLSPSSTFTPHASDRQQVSRN